MRALSTHHTLPPNPTWIDFPRTDGNAGQWAALQKQPVVDAEGHVNFYCPTDLDEPISIKWRKDIGTALASKLGMADGPSYVLRQWPDGYQMFDHNKGPEGAPRHDMYLIGSTLINRFRSVPEFIPHALWLIQDSTMDRGNCACKYCSKTPQRRITDEMGLLKRSSPDSPGAPRAMRLREPKIRSGSQNIKPYTSVRKATKPVKPPRPPEQTMLQERNNDLRATYARTEMKLNRIFREGELLWCALPHPIRGHSEEEVIFFWPGLAEEVKLKSEIDSTIDPQLQESASGSGDGPALWKVTQSTEYKVKLLATTTSAYFPDDTVIPYQAYVPHNSLTEAMRNINMEDPDPAHLPNFDLSQSAQVSDDHLAYFKQALGPYALAVHIASLLTNYWTITDDWEYKHGINSRTVRPPRPLNSSHSIHSMITASMSENEALLEATNGPADSISAPVGTSLPDTQSSGPPAPPLHTVTETRYQGLWWGPERIWVDDLVRLKISRGQYAPEGYLHDGQMRVLAPSGPSAEGDAGVDGSVTSAAHRGMVMRLDSLFIVEVPRTDGLGMTKECRASGLLYELADQAWVEPAEQPKTAENDGSELVGFGSASHLLTGEASSSSLQEGPSSSAPLIPTPPVPSVGSGTSIDVVPDRQNDPNTLLSRPALSDLYPPPVAPHGYKFRPILVPEFEAVVSLTLISGRYYPGLFGHPLVQPMVTRGLSMLHTGDEHSSDWLWALEGLAPGYRNSVDSSKWKPDRLSMLREADAEARKQLKVHWEERKNRELSVPHIAILPMDVDT